jgi:hypothetical protein
VAAAMSYLEGRTEGSNNPAPLKVVGV